MAPSLSHLNGRWSPGSLEFERAEADAWIYLSGRACLQFSSKHGLHLIRGVTALYAYGSWSWDPAR